VIMSSAWSKKLETKISGLSATSSKESIQTLSKWIGFNRKHAAGFVPVLERHLNGGKNNMPPVYLSVIHHVLVLDQENTAKWDKLADLRVMLGEMILKSLKEEKLPQDARDKLTSFLKEWDSSNVFGGPTMVNQLKRELAGGSSSTATATTAAAPPAKEASKDEKAVETASEKTVSDTTTSEKPPEDAPSKAAAPEKGEDSTKETSEAKKSDSTKTKAASPKRKAPIRTDTYKPSSTKAVVFDFESQGIPAAPVEMKELHEPCKSVATLQIARDLRNDSAQQISSLLAELPASVRKFMETGDKDQELDISDDDARDLSIQTNETAIDLNISDELSNIRMFRDIVEKQKSARQLLIFLLIKSRCQFGSEKAALAFTTAQRAMGELTKRKQILQDAMELEGATMDDLEDDGGDNADHAAEEGNQEELTLDWFKPVAEDEEPATKKTRVE